MSATLAANLVYEYLAAAARYRIKAGGTQLLQHAFDAQSGDLCEVIDFRRREAMQVNPVAGFQFAQQPR